MHRYHPATEAAEIDGLICLEMVPGGFEGDDPDAILFDHCKRCAEHIPNPMETLDRASRARLLRRGSFEAMGGDKFRSTAERQAWNNIGNDLPERTEL